MKIFKDFNLVIILVSFFFMQPLFAQEQKTLTLEESLQIGLQNSRQLHATLMQVKLADAQAKEIGASRFASLNLGASYTRLSEIPPFAITFPPFITTPILISPTVLDNYNLKLSLQQPLFTGFKLQSSYDAAKLNAAAANMDYTQAEQDLFLNIKNAYWNLFKVVQMQKVIEDEIQTVKAHLADVQNFYNQGLATQNDVLKIKVQLSQAELQKIDANNNIKLAMLNLNNVLSLPLDTKIKLADTVSVSETEIENRSLDDLVTEAFKNRPELKAISLRIDASQKGITAAKGDWYPQLFVAGEYDYAKPNQRLIPAENKFYGTWNVSLGLSYSLWNWGATSDKTEQAEANFEQAKDNSKLLKDVITLEVNQSYLNLLKSKQKILVSKETVKQEEENYRITDDRFKQGLTLNSELLDAEVALTEAKTDYVQSLVDYELSVAKMDRALGIK
jgi:outer membrane protein TolC